MKLYYKPGSCSMAVHVLLNELGVDVELIPYEDSHGEKHPELAKINPRANVPTIDDGMFHMYEGGAILIWLCDEHESDLLPRSGRTRGDALKWLMFANASLHPAYGTIFFLNSQTIGQAEKNALFNAAGAKLQSLWDVIEEQLAHGEYICGDQFTVADILMTVIANWTPNLPVEITFGPRSKALFKRISERPAYQKALEAEKIKYRVAA